MEKGVMLLTEFQFRGSQALLPVRLLRTEDLLMCAAFHPERK